MKKPAPVKQILTKIQEERKKKEKTRKELAILAVNRIISQDVSR